MHDLVVRERQHEVLGERVQHRERDLVVMPAAVHRILLDVLEHVVHPAHVPLVAEAETADVDRPADRRPRRRFLRDRDRARHAPVREHVELLEELDGLEVLAAAELVRNPLPRLARVIEVEHRRHRVDAQAVDVKLLEPEERVAEEERAHLVAAVVEDQRAPVLVLALARIGVLVERRAVELREAVAILRESGPAPSRGSRRCRADGIRRRNSGSRPAYPKRLVGAKKPITW